MSRLLLWLALNSWAQVDTGYKQCYCGGQFRNFGYTSESCESLCGGGRAPVPPRPSAPPRGFYDAGAEERRRKRERQEAERRREAAEDAARQREFELEKRELECSLKGADCSADAMPPTGDLELKTDTIQDENLTEGFDGGKAGDTQIMKIGRRRSVRDWGGPGERAWRQLHCAASFFGTGLASARKAVNQADLERVAYFGDEVLGALQGKEKGEPCPPADPMPSLGGRIERVKEQTVQLYGAMVEETKVQAGRLVQNRRLIERARKELSAAKPAAPAAATPEKPKDDLVERSRKLLEDAKKSVQKAEARLGELEAVNNKAAADPSSIGDLLASFSRSI